MTATLDTEDPRLLDLACAAMASIMGGEPRDWMGEAWMVLRRCAESFRAERGAAGPYVATAARRRALDLHRRWRRQRREVAADFGDNRVCPAIRASPLRRMVAREELGRAAAVVGEETRLAACGVTYTGIAAAVGAPLGTVKSRINAQRTRLAVAGRRA